MALELQADPLPLRKDEKGGIRVGGTRVLLELVIDAYRRGASPEEIALRFDALHVADVYTVIGHYLRHQGEIERYVAEREARGDDLQRLIESGFDRAVFRERLMARWSERRAGS
jgi:uncharacterized protein (DUF433 family)